MNMRKMMMRETMEEDMKMKSESNVDEGGKVKVKENEKGN